MDDSTRPSQSTLNPLGPDTEDGYSGTRERVEEMLVSEQDARLCQQLRNLPARHGYRFGAAAHQAILVTLFRSLTGPKDQYLRALFPNGLPASISKPWSLREAQGAVDGAEYGPAARGKPCGHIFKNGEATYRCKTCAIDDTCVLCSRCFDAADHDGHMIFIMVSPGNTGCCDCGDSEAWRRPVNCHIHTALPQASETNRGKDREPSPLPSDLVQSISMTVARALDYMCDVISCSPEQLRLQKTEADIRQDEKRSRLTSRYYDGDDIDDESPEFAMILWNDEKHTVDEVRDQVARACKQPRSFGLEKANETNDVGRSIIQHDRNVARLMAKSEIIAQIKVTVTIRSSRDTFREQMCGTIIEWLVDIAGCSVGEDNDILRHTICEEMLKVWRMGSKASNAEIGKDGIDDQQKDEEDQLERIARGHGIAALRRTGRPEVIRLQVPLTLEPAQAELWDESADEDGEEGAEAEAEAEDELQDEPFERAETMDPELVRVDDEDVIERRMPPQPTDDAMLDVGDAPSRGAELDADGDLQMNIGEEANDETEFSEATLAGYPPPPPPPPPPPMEDVLSVRTADQRRSTASSQAQTPTESSASLSAAPPLVSASLLAKIDAKIPRTPHNTLARPLSVRPPKYWLEKPAAYTTQGSVPLQEDLWKRVRLDWMILFDLRMWKKARIDLRDLYITTVVTIPQFKRILGLRFAGLYPTLAQLYLIADREPDHSIINLSLQMLTTPSITDEVVERGNFLTNMIAILYTFLTTRQVGYPQDILPNATLAFETGSLTNRRMYHFFIDLRYLLGSEHVQEKLRMEERYTLQFLDLVKLHQGICPNVRAVGDHIEYETDAWISASLITRELNRLCRQFAESFRWKRGEDDTSIVRTIRVAARAAILNATGAELKRFGQAEIKKETRFRQLRGFEMDTDPWGKSREYRVVQFVVEKEPISFHHGLHYTLSWLIEGGKSMSVDNLRRLISCNASDFHHLTSTRVEGFSDPEDFLLALFDFPLRVCAWLAQMKAGMWVRNGLSLRHQMSTYRGVSQRDVAHQRDIFLLQTALVTCDPSRVLASMITCFGMEDWMRGTYSIRPGWDENQSMDVLEELIHLMIVLLCDRNSLIPPEDEPSAPTMAVKRDIAHVLCFRPLSFSELAARLADKLPEMEEFQGILEEMTVFRMPEGLSDSGTFELKEAYIEGIDPYIAHYSKNQREEAENAYRTRIAKKTGQPADEVVFVPQLRPIPSGVFVDLAVFTRTALFAQIIYFALRLPLVAGTWTPHLAHTRMETYLHVVLHLTLLAIIEDQSTEDDMSDTSGPSFVHLALTKTVQAATRDQNTVVGLLQSLATIETFRSSTSNIRVILRKMQEKRPHTFASAIARLGIPDERVDTRTPASTSAAEEIANKKKLALTRQAKVMAQFQQQQQNFLNNQDRIDWDEDDLEDPNADGDNDVDDKTDAESRHGSHGEHRKMWRFPSGTCILCQEETDDDNLYGTFALIADSNILRQTDIHDPDFVSEVASVPCSLDRSAEEIRPFGVSGRNVEILQKLTADGEVIITQRQTLGKGFPASQVKRGPVTTGCGHIMHYICFQHYCTATQRRQSHQIARAHPERLENNEFVCPLCKALGNAFLPIIWNGKPTSFPGELQPKDTFSEWLTSSIGPSLSRLEKATEREDPNRQSMWRTPLVFRDYYQSMMIPPLAEQLDEMEEVLNPYGHSTQSHKILPLDASIYCLSPLLELSSDLPLHELTGLIEIYRRLQDTVKLNGLASRYSYRPKLAGYGDDFISTDTLAKTLGFSIASVEIAQRGVASEPGCNLLDKISTQTLTLLRILSETVSSFILIGSVMNPKVSKIMSEFNDIHRRQLYQLFLGHPQIFDDSSSHLGLTQVEPLLLQDPFIFLAECNVYLLPALHFSDIHVTKLCYLAELVRVVLAFIRDPGIFDGVKCHGEESSEYTTQQLETFHGFVCQLHHISEGTMLPGQPVVAHSPRLLRLLRIIFERYALVFLRKSVILLHVSAGVLFPNTGLGDVEEPEIARLSRGLRLESLDELMSTFQDRTQPVAVVLQSVVEGWIRHWMWTKESLSSGHQTKQAIFSLSHPGIFELVGLPKTFDTLTEEAMRRRCPTTGKDLMDPSICLFCGEIFCSQAQCCSRDGRIGGCNQHVEKCARHIGLFINIRKCTVLYLCDGLGSWHTAPYLDKHGEVDAGLRRNRQLFLSQKRYDALLRNVWLQHGVPTTISRKIEADVNSGGWETI